ncbi:SulP family inorganic anion transporter [Xanthobacter tagetidis]|uniref:STAS domain-containing protein n=1 Tax=Xanthobacter tagetidis TaxID=60216 RepID=A0A3L7AN39_9HYPH|nr:SulP family inorganic anion transporter [Xanthobacter tagetidis]MBB6308132.1 SulP family sulfate permease [Xanthobacter tagetidis]RLP81757.1 STAS domain-containing protein [Xanthobacter tagetidis]
MTFAANTAPARPPHPQHRRDGFVPKLVTTLMQGYRLADLRADAVAGLTVAIVALPLAMALAIASGASPDKGLVTVVVAGLLISALGGSRYQIGGPTGAFVVVVFNVIAQHGYDGLLIATLMAGAMLLVAGLTRLGNFMRYIPEPVVTGFTAGIAVIIFSSQVKDFLGLPMGQVPAEFLDKWIAMFKAAPGLSLATTALSVGALALILVLRKVAPKVPGFLIAVVAGALVVPLLGLQVETIGSRFGGISGAIPAPHLPDVTLARMWELLPSAFTIAFLAGVESLLSAVVADGMTGGRHRPNAELVAQGVANTASALFGGLPATGAIARTATNIRAGARSPMAGVLHAVFVLAVMLALAPLAASIPLASLAAILMVVAWNMSEVDRFRHLMSAPLGDRVLLISTFVLTVAVDLTVAIATGVVLAAVLFMHRMAETASVAPAEFGTGEEHDARGNLPAGVEIFQVSGPLFFGAAARFSEVLEKIGQKPRVFVLDMTEVPMMDATGVNALSNFARQCAGGGTALVVAGLQGQPRTVLEKMVHGAPGTHLDLVANIDQALALARIKAEA